jgi:hypothetical protein
MDSGYIENEFNYYRRDNFNNNLNFKLSYSSISYRFRENWEKLNSSNFKKYKI